MGTDGWNGRARDGVLADLINGGGSLPDSFETAIQNQHRREILRLLCEQGGEMDISTLGFKLTMKSENESLSSIIESLHRHHLPELASHGLVEYDPGKVVELVTDPGEVEAALEQWSGR